MLKALRAFDIRQTSLGLIHHLPGNQSEFHFAFHAGLVERRVLAAGMQFCRIDDKRFVRVETDEIGGRARR